VKFRDLWRLSRTVYKEISFQSIFSLRVGSSLPQRRQTDVNRLVRSAEINTLISKILTSALIAFLGFGVFMPLIAPFFAISTPKEIAVVASMSTFLASVMFLIVLMGLQVATSFMSSKIAETLSPLPLSKGDISNIIFMCFVRIFDIPLITAVIALLGFYFLAGGSFLGGFVAFSAVITTEIFAITLTIGLARFFYSRVAAGGGRSKWKTLLRFVFMLVWILPTFGSYFVMSFATQIAESSATLTQSLSSTTHFIALVYPFSFSFLVSYATYLRNVDFLVLGFSTASSLGYVALAAYCLKWVTRTVRRLGGEGFGSVSREVVKDTIIHPQRSWLGIIRKDLRIASRSPSYASLFLLPALQTAFLAVSFSSFGDAGFSVTLGVLTGVSMMTLLLPPTMFSIEGLASAYTRSLPLKRRTLIFAKMVLSIVSYLISLVALFIVTSFLRRDFTYILVFGAIHTFSVAAASMLELTILAKKFWEEGFTMSNIYARLSTFVLILIPGYILAGIPLIAAFITFFVSGQLVLPIFLATALSEFLIMASIALHETRTVK
jgi:hypothetical protein